MAVTSSLSSKSIFTKWLMGAVVVGFVGCATVKPEAIDPAADVQAELAKTEENLTNARAQQVDVLAPKNFALANDEFQDAKEDRDRGKDSEEVFESLGRSRAYLKIAMQAAAVTKTGLSETAKAREAALAAGAASIKEKELKELDDSLSAVAESAESGNIEKIRQHDKTLSEKYGLLELDAIKEKNLSTARDNIKQAEKEDATKWAGRTLEQVNAQFKTLEESISANRYDPALAQKSADLTNATTRLLNVTREAKKLEKTDAEELVLAREKASQSLATQKQQLAATSTALQSAEERAGGLAAQTAFDQKFEESRSMFSPEDAEVYRQADVLTIRLKALSFNVGDSSLGGGSFDVLQKVNGVIKKFDSPRITVEGHTDSTGSKATNMALSQARAEAVANYLVAQGVPQASISTVGYGDEKPLANNKTKQGRKQNRRVDVIIDSRRESVSL